MPNKLFVLSLDGTPYTLLQQALAQGRMPSLQKLVQEGSFAQMDSVVPTISSVAWATFATGVNPARHNIFGFVDVDPQKRFFIPNAGHLQAKALWQYLHERGLRAAWINLPIAYPPTPINGVMISGFLGTRLVDCVHPRALLPHLQKLSYIIDPDPVRAHSDRDDFMKELFAALRARCALTLQLLQSEPWDFFMLHIMETDRLHHFYWHSQDAHNAPYHRDFWNLYSEIDAFIEELITRLPKECALVMLSDHGFCAIQQEVELNALLREHGLLKFRNGSARDLADLDPQTRAFALAPGRFYLNGPGARETLVELLYRLSDPQTNGPICQRVYRREEIYAGPYLERAADLCAIPHSGYDFKARLNAPQLFTHTALQGMHTLDDAFLFVRNQCLSLKQKPKLIDLAPTICALMGIAPLPEYEGRNLLTERGQP